jgi:invasion protein IalB
VVCSASQLHAQTAPSNSPNRPAIQQAVDAEPRSTSASFGDWVLRCNRLDGAAPAHRICEIAQTVVVRGQRAPVAELALGRLNKTDSLRVTIVLPPNVAFPSGPRIYAEVKDKSGIELNWRRCLPNGCVADAIPKDEVIRAWRASKTAGRLETRDGFGRNVVVSVSFRGFSQALDALNKEP